MFTPSKYCTSPKSRSILLLLGILLLSGNIYASKKEDMADYQEKLDNLKANITKIQQHLKGSKKQRSTLLSELKSLEQEISNQEKNLSELESSRNRIGGPGRRSDRGGFCGCVYKSLFYQTHLFTIAKNSKGTGRRLLYPCGYHYGGRNRGADG
mgnify:CR=1 FL=1